MFCSKDKGHDHLLLSYKTIIVLNFTFRSAWYLELVIVYNTLSYKMVVGTDMFPIWISNGSSPSTENNCYFPPALQSSMLFQMSSYMCLVPAWTILANFLLDKFLIFLQNMSPCLLELFLAPSPTPRHSQYSHHQWWPRAGHLKSIPVGRGFITNTV